MLPQRTNNAIWFIIFTLTLFLVGNFIFTQYAIGQIKTILAQSSDSPLVFATLQPMPLVTATPTPVSVNSVTPTPKVVVVVQTPVPNSKITYIPLTGGNTQNTDWTNLSGSQFSLSISDYGKYTYAVWDANLRVNNANGTTLARLFDTTHGIAVNGSEINIGDTSTSTDVVSAGLSFWSGNNSYVVQLKSLNNSTAFMDSGRIKITY